ncbi:MAG: SDR family oxidoreductase [Verrucomicrobiaceae bacterium]|nr:SDR family oxidoreductase [Verrucomicrobiaceae bacterium]
MSNAESSLATSAPRVLVLGANGGLGRALVRELAHTCFVTAWTRADLDLSQPTQIAARLQTLDFDVLLNPAGLTSPDICELQPELAHRINAEAPGHLAAACQQRGARFIHFSTDYVFSGEGRERWPEDAETLPINEYGRSKLAGERAAAENTDRVLLARVSWLFGPDKPSHPDQIIARALQLSELSAITDKTSAPTFTRDICTWIAGLIHDHPQLSGPLHLCNGGSTSWHGWAEAALEIAQRLGLPVLTTELGSSALTEATFFKAPRPRHTTLDNTRLAQLLGAPPRDWRAALEAYLTAQYGDRSSS